MDMIQEVFQKYETMPTSSVMTLFRDSNEDSQTDIPLTSGLQEVQGNMPMKDVWFAMKSKKQDNMYVQWL
jgi:hypothetical protein